MILLSSMLAEVERGSRIEGVGHGVQEATYGALRKKLLMVWRAPFQTLEVHPRVNEADAEHQQRCQRVKEQVEIPGQRRGVEPVERRAPERAKGSSPVDGTRSPQNSCVPRLPEPVGSTGPIGRPLSRPGVLGVRCLGVWFHRRLLSKVTHSIWALPLETRTAPNLEDRPSRPPASGLTRRCLPSSSAAPKCQHASS